MTVLIKNVQVLRGDGSPAFPADIFIAGDKISAIGAFSDKSADEAIDGQGGYVAPGFIDVDTTSDHYLSLFEYPLQEDFLKQGVTTIIGGHCGSSLAPLLYGTLESIQKWTDISRINVDWHTVKELLAHLAERKIGVNFGTLTGHSTVRRAIVGEALRDLTPNEVSIFDHVLREALREGSFGLSTGLEYVHARNTSYKELKTLTSVVVRERGIYATHLRSAVEDLEKSVEETLKLAKDTGAKTLISHLVPLTGQEKSYRSVLETLDKLPDSQELYFDAYTIPVSTLPVHRLLPVWVRNGSFETMLKHIHDGWMISKIMKEMPELDGESLRIAEAPSHGSLNGKSLTEVQELYGLRSTKEALLQLMVSTGLRAVIHIRNVEERSLREALQHRRSLVASHAASFGPGAPFEKSERNTGTFPEFLRLSIDEKLMPLEHAVRKITSVPAALFGLRKRGELKEGNVADCTIFKESVIRAVVLGGKVVLRDGQPTGVRVGKVLRKDS